MNTLKKLLFIILLLDHAVCWGNKPLELIGNSFKHRFYTTELSSSIVDSIRVVCILSFAKESEEFGLESSIPNSWFEQVRIVSFKQGQIAKTNILWLDDLPKSFIRELTQKYLPYLYHSFLLYAERYGLETSGNKYSLPLVFLPNPPSSDITIPSDKRIYLRRKSKHRSK